MPSGDRNEPGNETAIELQRQEGAAAGVDDDVGIDRGVDQAADRVTVLTSVSADENVALLRLTESGTVGLAVAVPQASFV